MDASLEDQVTQLIQNELVTLNLQLFRIRVTNQSGRRVISLEIDHERGGITLDECVRCNRTLDRLLEENPIFTDRYMIEVSSPGVDHPLSSEKDYRRLTGKRIWVQYRDASGAVKENTGKVLDVEVGNLRLEEARDPAAAEIALERIVISKPEVLVKR